MMVLETESVGYIYLINESQLLKNELQENDTMFLCAENKQDYKCFALHVTIIGYLFYSSVCFCWNTYARKPL